MQIKGVDDAREFQDVLEAMQTLQFSASTVESLLKILAGVLALGNLEFERGSPETNPNGNKGEGDDEYARLTPQSEQETMKVVAELLALDPSLFLYSLTNKSVQMGKGGRGSVVSMRLSVTQAADARDTLNTSHVHMSHRAVTKYCALSCFALCAYSVSKVGQGINYYFHRSSMESVPLWL